MLKTRKFLTKVNESQLLAMYAATSGILTAGTAEFWNFIICTCAFSKLGLFRLCPPVRYAIPSYRARAIT